MSAAGSGAAGGGGGGGAVTSITSTDGSLAVTGSGTIDLSLHALGSSPEETTIVSKQSDFPAPSAGRITLVGRYTLTGHVVITGDIEFFGADGGDVAIEGAAGVEGCIIECSDHAGPLMVGSITLQNVTIKNTHASGEDLAIGDTTGRILHLRLVTSAGTSSGNLTAHAGGMEVFNFVQDGCQVGLTCAAAYGAIRFIGGFFVNTPNVFTAVQFTATSSVAAFLGISSNTYTTFAAATQFGFRLDDAMTVPIGAIEYTANTNVGLGATLDQGPGNMTADDPRIIATGNSDVADWLGKLTAVFRDLATPISFAPSGSIETFDVVPNENVGPTTTLVELAGSLNFRLVVVGIQNYYFEYIGARGGVTADVGWVLTAGKESPATGRATAAKLTVDRAPVTGTYTDVDGQEVTRTDFQVVGTLNTNRGEGSTVVHFGDRFTFELSSESVDLQDYSVIQLTAETR